jgi:pimeloyl-ACP methyl ester carboxylesterase
MTFREIELGDVTINCAVDGPENGPLAICLHGFPDTRHAFRHLTPVLVAAGYRVVAPAMRGYAPSSLAADGNYQLAALAHDASRLHDAFGGDERAVLIGHDWGAATTYLATTAEPERYRRAVTMAVPPLNFVAQSFGNVEQLRASWYMWFFQLPMADFVVPLNDYELIDKLWAQWSPGYNDKDERGPLRAALGTPENTAAVLGYYRAMFSGLPADPLHEKFVAGANPPTVPTLYLHGDHDGCMVARNIPEAIDHLAPGSRVELIANAGHFALLEQPDIVNAHIRDFLTA